MAKLRIELGPCDDAGEVWVNGALALETGLDQVETYSMKLDDGQHRVKFRLNNKGAWGWTANVRILLDGQVIGSVLNESGGTGAWAGYIKEVEKVWSFEIAGGVRV